MDVFASIAYPLTTLTQKSMKFEWSEARERSFKIFKYSLTSAPALTLLEGTKAFLVNYDVSLAGLGCLIMQHGNVESFLETT